MADPSELCRDWMLVNEDAAAGRLQLQPLGTDVPQRRGGYPRIELLNDGRALARRPGATDRPEIAEGGDGSWQLDADGYLTIQASGWEGRYRIEEASVDKLILLRD